MKKHLRALLVALVLLPLLIFAACGKTNDPDPDPDPGDPGNDSHVHSYVGAPGEKPWQIVYTCTCGNTYTETDYTKMTLQDLFDELSDNEGNFYIEMISNSEDGWAANWEVNDKTS